tara:strand:+ start:72 stop:221 length:150 start_codon:yes stop_codon:yes gene_type:complete
MNENVPVICNEPILSRIVVGSDHADQDVHQKQDVAGDIKEKPNITRADK